MNTDFAINVGAQACCAFGSRELARAQQDCAPTGQRIDPHLL
jgi:hypothetical protein